MKIALFGIAEIKHGKHNLKDPRLKQADKLVATDKKTHAQVDVVGKDQLLQADAVLALDEARADLILKDLEFVETRLGRDPQPVGSSEKFLPRVMKTEEPENQVTLVTQTICLAK